MAAAAPDTVAVVDPATYEDGPPFEVLSRLSRC
jgi:hypothetical protein